MQVILLDKVVNLGNLGEIVKVKDGYARNFLIPSGRARRATEAAKAEFEARRAELEKQAAEKLAAAQAQGDKLNGQTIKLTQKAGVDGRLFGSVTNHDIADELKKQGFEDAYVRPIAWRGSESLGVSAQNNRIHLAIAIWQWPSYFSPEEKMKGIRLDIAEYCRPDPRTAPSRSKAAGLYMICTISKHAAEAKGYADALMLDWRGQVAEATGANVFFVKDGALHTPKPDCFLDGITRRTIIDLAKRRGLEVIERVIMPEEMETFSECFLCGTAAEVTPVSEIGKYHFKPGEITNLLMNDYTAEVQPKRIAAE